MHAECRLGQCFAGNAVLLAELPQTLADGRGGEQSNAGKDNITIDEPFGIRFGEAGNGEKVRYADAVALFFDELVVILMDANACGHS